MRTLTLIALVLALTSSSQPASAASAADDTGSEMGIDAGTDGGSVDISGTERAPGSPDVPNGGGGEPGGEAGVAPGTSAPSADGTGLGGNPRRIVDALDPCAAADACAPTEEGAPAVTLADLASFAPSAPVIRMEPDGWMLRGLPANFIAVASEETVTGTLLARGIEVRFEPTSYTWVWGDGESDTVSTPGRTWEQLQLPRFSETATSHTYAERGSVTVSLRVASTVSYRFDDGDWRPVDGSVTATAAIDAYVGSAQTVLVPDDCRTAPRAGGC
jgi:hypothetical protein